MRFLRRPPRWYQSVHAMAESGLFDALLEGHYDSVTFQLALYWEQGIIRET